MPHVSCCVVDVTALDTLLKPNKERLAPHEGIEPSQFRLEGDKPESTGWGVTLDHRGLIKALPA